MKKILALFGILLIGLTANAVNVSADFSDTYINEDNITMENIWRKIGKREEKINLVGSKILNANKIPDRVNFVLARGNYTLNAATYYSTKAYVLRLTTSIYEELRREKSKVVVSCLCPGPVRTSFQSKAGIKKSESAKKYLMSAEDVAKECLKKFEKNKAIIIPGFKNKVLVVGNKLIPRALSRKIIQMTNKG